MLSWLQTQWPALVAILVALATGAVLTWLLTQRRLRQLESDNIRLRTELESERRGGQQLEQMLAESREQLANTFNQLSREQFKHNSEQFLSLAQEKLAQFQMGARADLGERQKAVEDLVKPVREALEKTERHLHEVEKERKQSYGSIENYLRQMTDTQRELQNETARLVKALRRPEVRGQWGQLSLRRLAELAGMVDHCDFYEEEHRRTGSGDNAVRPDMVIRLPEDREIVVDVKTPLDSYLSAIEADNDTDRQLHLKNHARKVRERVRELASKSYWDSFKKTPDFVVLFIPGDQFLSAAMDVDDSLLEDALRQQIVLATPTSFIALLRAVAYGWRQLSVAENAEKIRETGEELYRRLATFAEHLGRVGRSLDATVKHYNSAVGSLERQVMPGARRFPEMGIQSSKRIEEPEQLERTTRQITPDREE